jgi:hypothetical protein
MVALCGGNVYRLVQDELDLRALAPRSNDRYRSELVRMRRR